MHSVRGGGATLDAGGHERERVVGAPRLLMLVGYAGVLWAWELLVESPLALARSNAPFRRNVMTW